MRSAPPVDVQGTGGAPWRFFQAALPALAAGVFTYWALAHLGHPDTWGPTAALLTATVVGLLCWRLNRVCAMALRWDGQQWTVDGAAATVAVMLDLQGWLLLRLQPASSRRPTWLALSATEVGPAWHALRVALYGAVPALASSSASSSASGPHV